MAKLVFAMMPRNGNRMPPTFSFEHPERHRQSLRKSPTKYPSRWLSRCLDRRDAPAQEFISLHKLWKVNGHLLRFSIELEVRIGQAEF